MLEFSLHSTVITSGHSVHEFKFRINDSGQVKVTLTPQFSHLLNGGNNCAFCVELLGFMEEVPGEYSTHLLTSRCFPNHQLLFCSSDSSLSSWSVGGSLELFKREGLVIWNSEEFGGWTQHLVTRIQKWFPAPLGRSLASQFLRGADCYGDDVRVLGAFPITGRLHANLPSPVNPVQLARECVVHMVTPKHCRLGLRRDRKMRRWTWPKDWLSLSAGSQAENGRRPGTMLELRNRHLDLSIRPHQDSLQWVERSRSSLVLWVYTVDRIAHQWRHLVVDEWWTACPWYLRLNFLEAPWLGPQS